MKRYNTNLTPRHPFADYLKEVLDAEFAFIERTEFIVNYSQVNITVSDPVGHGANIGVSYSIEVNGRFYKAATLVVAD